MSRLETQQTPAVDAPLRPELRVLVALPRSGSTMTMGLLAEHPAIKITSRATLIGASPKRSGPRGQARPFKPNYQIFQGAHGAEPHPGFSSAGADGRQSLVTKEEVGNDRFTGTPGLNECNYPIFPDDQAMRTSRPVFLIRDPKSAFDSWLSKGWNDIDSFISAYRNVHDTYQRAKEIDPNTPVITHNAMCERPENLEAVMRRISDHWDIPFNPAMLKYDNEKFAAKFSFATDRERTIYRDENPKGLFTTVKQFNTPQADIPAHDLISTAQADRLEQELGPLFRNMDQTCRLQIYRQQRAAPVAPAASQTAAHDGQKPGAAKPDHPTHVFPPAPGLH